MLQLLNSIFDLEYNKIIKMKFILICIISILSLSVTAQEQYNLTVQGECGMCQDRIEETALGFTGIISAVWNSNNKILTLEVSNENSATFSILALHDAISMAGHDTDKYDAPDDVYKDLPACCQYRELEGNESETGNAQEQYNLTVQGECGMCQDRIEETALGFTGIISAGWNSINKILTIEVSNEASAAFSILALHDVISLSGHDTDKYDAPDDVYNDLPACCQYRELEGNESETGNDDLNPLESKVIGYVYELRSKWRTGALDRC